MIVKFLPTRNGGGIESVNYLLNERREQGTARILKGSEAQTRAIIRQIPYKQKTCFGVLSFSENPNQINNKIKQEIIKDFERTLLGDYMKERINILWVEHTDKGRLELNFVIPKIDLVTGKSFNPYYAKADQFNIDLWKRTINDEYHFSSPNDPKNQYNQNRHKATLEQHYTIIELDNTLKELVAQGIIKSRSHMIELLNSNGYEVTRQPKSGISIKFPNQKKPFRLRGGIYSADFTDIDKLSQLGETQSRRIQQYANRDTQTECLNNRRRISENIQKRDRRNQERYKERNISNSQRNTPSQKNYVERNEAGYNRKIMAWNNTHNLDNGINNRIFYSLQNIQQSNIKLSNTNQHTIERKPILNKMANSREFENDNTRQDNKERITLYNYTGIYPHKRRNKIISNTQWRSINDTTRNRIIQRDREITKRNYKIAEQDRKRAEREQEIIRRKRKIAIQQHISLLSRLRERFRQEQREYIIRLQKSADEFRKRFKSITELTRRIKTNFNDLQRQFRENGLQAIIERLRSIKTTIQEFRRELQNTIENRNNENISRINNEYDRKFRECLEREIKRASVNCGYEIERKLKELKEQRIIKQKRELQKQNSTFRMRM